MKKDNKFKRKMKPVLQVAGYFLRDNKPAFACLIYSVFMRALTPYIQLVMLGSVLDGLKAGADFSLLIRYVLTALGLQLFMVLTNDAARQYYNQKMEYMSEIENGWLNRKAFSMDYEYLEDVHVQELRARGERTWQGVSAFLQYQFERILTALIGMIAAVVILLPLIFGGNSSAVSNIFSVLTLLMIAGTTIFSYAKSAKYSKAIQELYNIMGEMGNKEKYYYDILAAAESQKDLRIFGQQETILRDLTGLFGKYRKQAWDGGGLLAKKALWELTLSDLSALIVYLFTGIQAFIGYITVGQVVTYASSIIRFSSQVALLATFLGTSERVLGLCADQAEYMNLEKRKYDGTIPVEKRRDNRFKVQFEHVSFRYPGTDTDIIKDLNLEFTIGERMAIVGKNGSGKTTFIKLLCRLYDVTEGCIKVNDVDIRKYDYQEYCNLFSVVFQDFRMFAVTVGENVAASVDIDEAKALDALDRAGLGERVRELPEGLGTYVGTDFCQEGVNFSGGEKQKMAIARAIYKDAPFVIMDEPTAALDPESECQVYAGFDRMVGNKTALYISHRLASCRFCQDILVFDNGQVVQRGSHEELERQEGLYRELWSAQAQYYET